MTVKLGLIVGLILLTHFLDNFHVFYSTLVPLDRTRVRKKIAGAKEKKMVQSRGTWTLLSMCSYTWMLIQYAQSRLLIWDTRMKKEIGIERHLNIRINRNQNWVGIELKHNGMVTKIERNSTRDKEGETQVGFWFEG